MVHVQSLDRLAKRGKLGAEPLPPPFPSWASRKMVLRKGNVALFAAVAGMHKTMVVLNAILNMGVSTLVFSSDSDDMTVMQRLIAIKTGRTTDAAEEFINKDPEGAAKLLRPYRKTLKWQFNPQPTLDDIWLEAYAWYELRLKWPELIVVDILSDVSHQGGDEWATLREVMRISKVLARETGSAILLVHHCTEGIPESKVCPSRQDVMGKLSAQPSLMVTFGKDQRGQFHAACVKNRFGPSKKDGTDHFPMDLDPARSKVGDYTGLRLAQAAEGEEDGEWWK